MTDPISIESAGTPLSTGEKARVLALSSTIAGALLFLYFLDYFILGHFEHEYLFYWPFVVTDPRISRYWAFAPPVLFGLWSGLWMLSGVDAFRNPGSRRQAVVSLGALIGGLVVAAVNSHLVRTFVLTGTGVHP